MLVSLCYGGWLHVCTLKRERIRVCVHALMYTVHVLAFGFITLYKRVRVNTYMYVRLTRCGSVQWVCPGGTPTPTKRSSPSCAPVSQRPLEFTIRTCGSKQPTASLYPVATFNTYFWFQHCCSYHTYSVPFLSSLPSSLCFYAPQHFFLSLTLASFI